MMDIDLQLSRLNREHFTYLQECFDDPPFTSTDLDDLYSYLYFLKERNIRIIADEIPDELSSYILRVIFDVHDDHHGFGLEYVQPEEHKNKLILDVEKLKEGRHDYLKELFGLPEYYGRNLDALYDCLSEMDDLQLIIINTEAPDSFVLDVLSVLDEVADDHHNLTITYEYDETA